MGNFLNISLVIWRYYYIISYKVCELNFQNVFSIPFNSVQQNLKTTLNVSEKKGSMSVTSILLYLRFKNILDDLLLHFFYFDKFKILLWI